ncbi:MAG: hypothetical protein CL607_25630 [Anaerolineaceae bacterium]|nr:hypothetical protein [Anaerolineaceae bacterium]
MTNFLTQIEIAGQPRWAIQQTEGTFLLPTDFVFSQWLAESIDQPGESITALIATATEKAPDSYKTLPPVDQQEVWAAGVTYLRSRDARQEEAEDGGDVYWRVYQAERPELFFKSLAQKVVPDGDLVGIREDATWNVPEAELALVLNPAMQVVGFTIGNDMSSRDIEGANPLYLPQAKVYDKSCAIGPRIWLNPATIWPEVSISITIERDGQVVFSDETDTSQIKRSLGDLASYLGRSHTLADGAILLTGTGVVPPSDFTLQVDDVIKIKINPIGTLTNTVCVV